MWIREGRGLASTLFFIDDWRGDDIEKFGYAVKWFLTDDIHAYGPFVFIGSTKPSTIIRKPLARYTERRKTTSRGRMIAILAVLPVRRGEDRLGG
jgi:hypothetical protein